MEGNYGSLHSGVYRGFTEYLNENGLCETKEDCQKIIEKNAKMIFRFIQVIENLRGNFIIYIK